MNYRYFVTIAALIWLVTLAWCGSSTITQSVNLWSWRFDIADSYTVVPSSDGAQLTYRAGSGDNMSVIQMSQSRVNSGITIDQMSSLNLQKLELSLPGYDFVEQSARSIDCKGSHDGQIVSFITQEWDHKLFHSQYYSIVDDQWYVWSVSSTSDSTRKTLVNMIKSASCE